MSVDRKNVQFLVFDVEAIADGRLISRVRYPNEDLSEADAILRFKDELMEQRGSDVIPPTYMLPISVAAGKVGADYRLLDLTVLDAPEFRPEQITRSFWEGWKYYERPTLVTFNGRGYDMPVLELAAFRYGLTLPSWFNTEARSFEQARNRYNTSAHLDLQDFFSNFSAVRISGGLNMLSNIIEKPGKSGVDGSMVQDMYDNGQSAEINDYCRCDVLDTYFVFLRTRVLMGKLTLEEESAIIADTREWLIERADKCAAYATYLEHWSEKTSTPFSLPFTSRADIC